MSVREVSSAEFYQLSRRTEGKLLVTQFTATWCGPCRRVAPQYEDLARRTPDVEFVKVYEHNSRDAIISSGVRSFPTFHFYLGGVKVDECRGAIIAQVEQKVNQHKAAAGPIGGPVMAKLRFERLKPRQSGDGFILVAEEVDLEVHASEGLEILKFQVLSITDIETDEQALTAGDSNTPITSDADLTSALRRTGGGVYGNYPVIRVSKRASQPPRGLPQAGGGENDNMVEFRRRVSSGVSGALAYEDAQLQAKARAVLPREGEPGGSIAQRGEEMAAASGCSREEGLARALLSWFKKEFFKWTNKPPCSGCGVRGASVQGKGGCRPTPEEASAKASRVELYECTGCKAQTRFPRYNDPAKLIETRNGRCGEWANCFTLMCRTVGLEARHTVDWTDHVWTEIWIPDRERWVHTDPCENKFDKPLMYEQGWNKKLSYVIAFDRNGGVDVTRRYTRQWGQVLSRRNLVPEKWLAGVLAGHSMTRTEDIVARIAKEQQELKEYESMGCDRADLDSEEKEGRQSGDAEWIASRGEGGGATSASAGPNQVASRLVGVPLGVAQPGGGLSLCVAAIVEGSGSTSVLVGGATVCRMPSRTHGALCAAAVSAATGTVLDSKVFVLSCPSDSAEVATWLAGQPDGAIVAIAISGGNDEAINIDDRLKEAMAGLVGNADPSIAGKSTTEEGGSKLGACTLVGWKRNGDGPPEWAHRQHKRAGRGGGGVAVYAELLLTSSATPLAGTPATAPKLVELKGKLCLCPLRSVSDDNALGQAPSRGVCRRAGEPSVSVGPTIDLVDCPGWTTVLQAPEAERATVDDGTDKGAPRPPNAWMVTAVHPAVGSSHEDTEEFDDGPVGCPSFVMGGYPFTPPVGGGGPFLPVGRVREIVGWSGDNVNGVQVVYDVEGDTVRGPKRMGDHGLYRQSRLVLDVEGGEVLTEVTVKGGSIVDSLHVRTNKGQEKKWGGNGGHLQHTWRIPSETLFLGFHGGVGGHLHSLGVTLAEKRRDIDVKSVGGGESTLPSVVKTSLYTTNPVLRACGQFLAFNIASAPESAAVAPAEVVTALETMRKYADNLLASPQDPKVSRIRLGNNFFDRKIGRLPGGGLVIRAMGFELADEEGRMHYVFRRKGAGSGLEGLRRARQTLVDLLASIKQDVA